MEANWYNLTARAFIKNPKNKLQEFIGIILGVLAQVVVSAFCLVLIAACFVLFLGAFTFYLVLNKLKIIK